jgi:hypothetical protein
VLQLTLNKKPEAKPKQIQVKAVSAGSNGTAAPRQVEGTTQQM